MYMYIYIYIYKYIYIFIYIYIYIYIYSYSSPRQYHYVIGVTPRSRGALSARRDGGVSFRPSSL